MFFISGQTGDVQDYLPVFSKGPENVHKAPKAVWCTPLILAGGRGKRISVGLRLAWSHLQRQFQDGQVYTKKSYDPSPSPNKREKAPNLTQIRSSGGS